jgi:aspartate 4-decarboxylase
MPVAATRISSRPSRRAFFQLGLFAMEEAEQTGDGLPAGVAGLPVLDGIASRFQSFLNARHNTPGCNFLAATLNYVRDNCAFDDDAFIHELAQGVLGCNYPEPPRMLRHAEAIVRRYVVREMAGPSSVVDIDLCAVEGATAGVTYIFNSLRENNLISPGDTIAIGAPIFTPYLEIPLLNDYRLDELLINADPAAGWQYPDTELAKIEDPKVKALLLVNPGNPASVKLDRRTIRRIEEIVTTKRPDLIILTDDVYATLADDFVSLFALCPRNTILIYSLSKYFGATGWRLGVVAMALGNVIDDAIRCLPEEDLRLLDTRYASLVLEPRHLKFIDRLVADSRAIAFNHTAGLSTPQRCR